MDCPRYGRYWEPRVACAKKRGIIKQEKGKGEIPAARANKKRNDNEKQTLKIGFFICIGKSNQANVKTPARHMHTTKPFADPAALHYESGQHRKRERGWEKMYETNNK